MNTCHVVSSISRVAAGVSKVVIDLSTALLEHDCKSSVVTLEDVFLGEDRKLVKVPIFSCRRHIWPKLGYSFDMQHQIGQQTGAEIIHSHGLWMYPNFAAGAAAKKLKLPHIVSPHGMLEPWALQRRAQKKRLVWKLFQRRVLAQARVLHATAEQEARHFREVGLKNPIAIIPNGVYTPELRSPAVKNPDEKTFLFLSRVHPIKGLINLVEAWNILHPKGWKVLIAGPDAGGHVAEVQQHLQHLQLEDSFQFIGPVYKEKKWDLYRSADVFILPSFSENFGIVIAEALASEIPVITTTATPWKDLLDHHCGWWINVGIEPLVRALQEAILSSDQQRREMGERGRRLIQSSYSWDKIATDMTATYAWMLGGGAPPACVMTD